MRSNSPILMSDLRKDYEAQKDLGSALLACNLMIVPVIMPEVRLLFQSFPIPYVTNTDSVDLSAPGGLQWHVPGPPKTSFDGSIQLLETDKSRAREFTELIMASGGTTDCIVYQGRPDRFVLQSELIDCAFTFEPGEGAADGRQQAVLVGGGLKYMYFGETSKIGGGSSGINTNNEVVNRILSSVNQLIANSMNRSLGQIFG